MLTLLRTEVLFAGNNRETILGIKKRLVRPNGHMNLHAIIEDPRQWGCASDVICGGVHHDFPEPSVLRYALCVQFETEGPPPLGIVHALLAEPSNPEGYCRQVRCVVVAANQEILDRSWSTSVADLDGALKPRRVPIRIGLSPAPHLGTFPFAIEND